MAMLGLSTVMESVLVWYSAGQALLAGTAIVAALIALESWLSKGKLGWDWRPSRDRRPGIWMGGLMARPCRSRLTADRRGNKRAALAVSHRLGLPGWTAGRVGQRRSNRPRAGSPPHTAAKAVEAVVRPRLRSRRPWCSGTSESMPR